MSVKQILLIAICGGCVAFAGVTVRSYMSGGAPQEGHYSWYIDDKTGEAFKHANALGESIPIKAPSGDYTGYPTEACYWTKDGQVSDKPTRVLLNEAHGLPGPTFCPVCGRLVEEHNPRAMAGKRPPPTQEEWKATEQAKGNLQGQDVSNSAGSN